MASLCHRFDNRALEAATPRFFACWHAVLAADMLYSSLCHRFENRALEALPIDASLRQGVSAEPIGADETKESTLCTYPRNQIARACFSLARATPLSYPTLVAASADALSLLNLDAQQAERDEFVSWFSGNQAVPGTHVTRLLHAY
jgi:hypothetical protein